jgi:hypothetical protein
VEKRAVKVAVEAAKPFLHGSENVEHVSRVRTQPPTHERAAFNVASAAAGIAMTSLLGAGGAIFTVPQTFCLLLTDQRLLFLSVNPRNAQPVSNVEFELPRNEISAERVRSFPSGKVRLSAPGREIVTLVYPLGVRMDGTNLLKAMTATAEPT